jgi:hypothetical protein
MRRLLTPMAERHLLKPPTHQVNLRPDDGVRCRASWASAREKRRRAREAANAVKVRVGRLAPPMENGHWDQGLSVS